MEHIKEPIKNAVILSNRYILREGFPFTSVTYPANVYDAILIKPFGATSFSPRFPTFKHSIDDYVVFINKYNLDKAVVIAEDISFLTKCPTLKYLNIIPSDTADNNFDFSPIFSLPELLSLCCNTEYGYNFSKKSTIDYSNVNGLVNLSMSGTGHLNSNEIKTLKSISVSDYKENNLYKLFNSIHLDTLQIVNSSIRSLEGIEQSEKLQCLDLSYNRRLEDIALLENFSKSLKYLEIVNCPKIKDLSIIEKFEKLETLKML